MLNGLIDFSLRHRFLVILATVAFAVVGAVSLRYLDIDAFPDTTPEVQRPLATVVIGGVISAMVMSLLVIRVLYVFFDAAASAAQRFLTGWLGFRAEQLMWLFGEHGREEAETAEAGARDGTADGSAPFTEQAHA